jgi:hypothetical protein
VETSHIQIVLGSTRPDRFSEKVRAWIEPRLAAREDLTSEVIDLRDHPLPFYEQSLPPAYTDATTSAPRFGAGEPRLTRPTATCSSCLSTTTATPPY